MKTELSFMISVLCGSLLGGLLVPYLLSKTYLRKRPKIQYCEWCNIGIITVLDSGTYWCSNLCSGTEDQILGVATQSISLSELRKEDDIKSFGEVFVKQVSEGYKPAIAAMPHPKDKWVHKNGNIYEIKFVTNQQNFYDPKHPMMVIYKGFNGKLWSKPLSDWFSSMNLVETGSFN